jgi:hypothetical protein
MEEQKAARRSTLTLKQEIAAISEGIPMRFLRNLFLALLCVPLTASAVLFTATYSLLSCASPSLVMTMLDRAGGTETLVKQAFEFAAEGAPIDDEQKAILANALEAAVTTQVVRDITTDVVSGLKRFLSSGGQDTAITLDLRPMKTAFIGELRKSAPAYLVDELETALENIPDKPNLSQLVPIEGLRGAVEPYRIFTNLPLIAGVVAGVCALLMCLILGWRSGGLRLAGACLLVGGLAVLIATSASPGFIDKSLLGNLPVRVPDIPIKIELRAIAKAGVDYILTRARLVSGACAALGGIFVLIPRRKAIAFPG